jgi:hypothetical protein
MEGRNYKRHIDLAIGNAFESNYVGSLGSPLGLFHRCVRRDWGITTVLVGNECDGPRSYESSTLISEKASRPIAIYTPSREEKMEYSLVVTPVTVWVSRIIGGLLLFLVWSSDLWYAKVNGGSPVRVNTISAWSPVHAHKFYGSWAMRNGRAYPREYPAISSSHCPPVRKAESERCSEGPSRQSCTSFVGEPQR